MGVSKANVAVKGTWSGVYNDHTVPYDGSSWAEYGKYIVPAHYAFFVKAKNATATAGCQRKAKVMVR